MNMHPPDALRCRHTRSLTQPQNNPLAAVVVRFRSIAGVHPHRFTSPHSDAMSNMSVPFGLRFTSIEVRWVLLPSSWTLAGVTWEQGLFRERFARALLSTWSIIPPGHSTAPRQHRALHTHTVHLSLIASCPNTASDNPPKLVRCLLSILHSHLVRGPRAHIAVSSCLINCSVQSAARHVMFNVHSPPSHFIV